MNNIVEIKYDEPTSPDKRGFDAYEDLDPPTNEIDGLSIRVAYGGRMIAVVGEAEGEAPEGTINGKPIEWNFEPYQTDNPQGSGDWLSMPIEDGEHEIAVNDWTGTVVLKAA